MPLFLTTRTVSLRPAVTQPTTETQNRVLVHSRHCLPNQPLDATLVSLPVPGVVRIRLRHLRLGVDGPTTGCASDRASISTLLFRARCCAACARARGPRHRGREAWHRRDEIGSSVRSRHLWSHDHLDAQPHKRLDGCLDRLLYIASLSRCRARNR